MTLGLLQVVAAHLEPAWTVPPAVAIGIALTWYWLRLGREDVPPSRRRIRRISIALMVLTLPMLVRALSFLSPQHQPRAYIMMWSLIMLMLLLVFAAALLDMANNLRLHQQHAREDMRDAAQELVQALEQRRAQQRGKSNGTAS